MSRFLHRLHPRFPASGIDPEPGKFVFVDNVGYYCKAHCDKLAACNALFVQTGVTVQISEIIWTWIRLEQQGWNFDYANIFQPRTPPGPGIFSVTLAPTDPAHDIPAYRRHSWQLAKPQPPKHPTN